MSNKIKYCLFVFCFPLLLFSQPVEIPNVQEGIDTFFIQVDAQYNKYVYHKVLPKQTLYRISKFYGLKLSVLYYHNPELKDRPMKIDERIRIPISTQSIVRQWTTALERSAFIPVVYVARPKETMYTIAKKYFEMTPELLQLNSHKEDQQVGIDEPLLVGWISKLGINDSTQLSRLVNPKFYAENAALRNQFLKFQEIKKVHKENGIAFWKKKEAPGATINFLALHRKAPINSVIKITNPMTRRTYFAKVTGRVPKSTYDRNIKVVISPSLAKALGAIDAKFHVKIDYLR